MERLTHERVNGIKKGYWTNAKKDDLVDRLAAYEEIGLEPDEVRSLINDRLAAFEEIGLAPEEITKLLEERASGCVPQGGNGAGAFLILPERNRRYYGVRR